MILKNNINNKKRVWEFPWQFTESFIILSTFIILSFFLDFITQNNTAIKLNFPTNIYVIVSFITVVTGINIFLKHSEIIKWLRSGKLAIVSIIWLLILVLVMGIIEQDNSSNNSIINKLNLNNIIFSKAFYFIQFTLLTNILSVVISKLNSFKLQNILFIINHLGIFILIISLSFGAGDIEKYTLKIDKENYLWQFTKQNISQELPFALKLKEFDIEMFPAKIAIVENSSDNILEGNDKIISANKDSIIYFNEYKISLTQYLQNAIYVYNKYYFVNDQGSAPAAEISIKSKTNEKTNWVSCGSFIYPSRFISIDSNYTIVMLEPEPKSFKSDIEVFYPNGKKENIRLEVNKPVNIKGWDIYQTDYNKKMGKWSEYSVVEMVKDPWLNYVYIGIFMMMMGATGLILIGKNNN
jgi:hypothetical protein